MMYLLTVLIRRLREATLIIPVDLAPILGQLYHITLVLCIKNRWLIINAVRGSILPASHCSKFYFKVTGPGEQLHYVIGENALKYKEALLREFKLAHPSAELTEVNPQVSKNTV